MFYFKLWIMYSILQTLAIYVTFRKDKRIYNHELPLIVLATIIPIIPIVLYSMYYIKDKLSKK